MAIYIKTTSKLEYFLMAGVNIGWDFYELSERIINNKFQQPNCIYDIAFNAQKIVLKTVMVEKLILELLNSWCQLSQVK